MLVDAHGRVLIARRRPGTPGAGQWEFPGGKCEPGENVADALRRELLEEVGVEPTRSRPLLCFSHRYQDLQVLLDIHRVEAWRGEVHGRERQKLAWCRPDALGEYDLLAANRPVVAALRLPPVYAITPELADPGLVAAGVQGLLARGVRLLRLRAWGLPDAAYETLARQLQPAIAQHSASLLLDRDFAMCRRVRAAGLHWPAAKAQGMRPLPADYWFAVSCHDRSELQASVDAGADFAVLSPVAATGSHPGRAALGWHGFARMRADLPLPVYALGGVGEADLDSAWRHGAQGVAGIRAMWPGLP